MDRYGCQQRDTDLQSRVDADYELPGAGVRPVRITYLWEEGGIKKQDVHVTQAAQETYTITCESQQILRRNRCGPWRQCGRMISRHSIFELRQGQTMRLLSRVILTMGVLFWIGSLAVRPARAQFDEMVKHVPRQANAIFLVNAEKAFASEIAKSQGWQAMRGKRFDSGLTCIPAKATHMVIASQLDLESMHPAWEAAIVEFPAAPSLEDIKQHFGGLDDMIANYVRGPRRR